MSGQGCTSARYCACLATGSACTSACGCPSDADLTPETKCRQDVLEALFGHQTDGLRMTACFLHYYLKHGQTAVLRGSPQTLFEALGPMLVDGDGAGQNIFEIADMDKDASDWVDNWRAVGVGGSAEQKVPLLQQLFRHGLSNRVDGHEEWYFSFCMNGWQQSDSIWHCATCDECMDLKDWHCRRCNKCTYGRSLPCEGCRGVSDDYDDRDERFSIDSD